MPSPRRQTRSKEVPRERPARDLNPPHRRFRPRGTAGALSGFAFTVFLALAWFLNGAETPHYLAPDHDWTTWANNTEMKGRFAAFFALLAGLTFLPFAATVRALLGGGEGR